MPQHWGEQTSLWAAEMLGWVAWMGAVVWEWAQQEEWSWSEHLIHSSGDLVEAARCWEGYCWVGVMLLCFFLYLATLSLCNHSRRFWIYCNYSDRNAH